MNIHCDCLYAYEVTTRSTNHHFHHHPLRIDFKVSGGGCININLNMYVKNRNRVKVTLQQLQDVASLEVNTDFK